MVTDSNYKFKTAVILLLIASASILFAGCGKADPYKTDTEYEAPAKISSQQSETSESAKPPQTVSASPVSLYIVNGTDTPTPDDFVTDVRGKGEVTARFAEDYDFTYPHDLTVTVILTDEEGNTAEIEAFAHCVVSDVTAPEINVGSDIYITVGGTVSYKKDVTVTDNSGEEISYTVDNSAVNTDAEGAYTVIYSAADSAGNKADASRTVYVTEELPPSEDEVMALATEIYKNEILTSELLTEDADAFSIAYAIYDWCYNSITFDLAGTNRSKGPLKLAYDGFTTLNGDCYTYMITSKYLLMCAGIDCIEITRLRYEGESNHYWLLVNVGDGWYHFDSTRRTTGKGTDTFMLTDAEVEEFSIRFDVPHYFRFDNSLYPERASESYFENAIPD